MKRLAILLAIAAIVAYATGAFAFLNDNGKVVMSIRGPHDAKARCEDPNHPTPLYCSGLVLSAPVGTYDVQILVADFNNLTAEEFGICYPAGITIWADKLDCTPNAFVLKSPNPPYVWPNSGGGVVVAHGCVNYTGTLLNLGFLYMTAYEPGTLCICGSPRAFTVELTDCDGKTDVIWPGYTPSHIGCVGFGMAGYNGMCGESTPATPSTWGNIKALYK
jgi:hypothetical protein